MFPDANAVPTDTHVYRQPQLLEDGQERLAIYRHLLSF